MLRNCQLILTSDRPASIYAGLLWERMDQQQRAAILWDLEDNVKSYAFEDAVRRASLVAVGANLGMPEVLAWMQDTAPGSQTACIHLACASIPAILDYGRAMLAQVSYQCLYCLLPAAWLGPLHVARALGFNKIAALPQSLWLARRKRLASGVMLQWLRAAPPWS